jgi:hypothetical protein
MIQRNSKFDYCNFVSFLLAALLLTGCSKGSSSDSDSTPPAPTTNISGTVTFTRIPLLKNASGVPTGLETDSEKYLTAQPARRVNVRAYQYTTETPATGASINYWKLISNTYTDLSGKYAFTLPQGKPLMVQLTSEFTQGNVDPVNLIGDPNGIQSSIPAPKRLRYTLRKAVDGTPATSTNLLPSSSPTTTTATVDFTVGLSDKWILSDVSTDPSTGIASGLSSSTMEAVGSGSRILAILDSIYKVENLYSSSVSSEVLDLHYLPGRREARGSYVDYNQNNYPIASTGNNSAFNASTGRLHYFGTLGGSVSNDDAWDESVIMGLVARNMMFSYMALGTNFMKGITPVMPTLPETLTLTHLHPMLAYLQGHADLMIASTLTSPYFSDTFLGGITVRDIRNIGGLSSNERSPYSAPVITALGWEILLKGNSITSPGSPSDWAKLDSIKTLKYFFTSFDSLSQDCPNIYRQLSRLQEVKTAADSVDLASIFTDSALTSLLGPFNIVWPRPVINTIPVIRFVQDYSSINYIFGTPTTLPSISFTMANAQSLSGIYPNASEGEIALGRLALSKDTAYFLTVNSSIALPSGSITLDIPTAGYKYTYPGTTNPTRIVLRGNSANAVIHTFSFRINSPLTTLPAHTVTVTLTPTN